MNGNDNGERRHGVFYRNMFWGLLGGVATISITITISIGAWAYGNMARQIDAKLDKETFLEVVKRIDGSLSSMDEILKAIWRNRNPNSRPHE